MEAPHNTEFYTWMGKKHFCFFQTAETGNQTPSSSVKSSGANHYPRAPALKVVKYSIIVKYLDIILDNLVTVMSFMTFLNTVAGPEGVLTSCFQNEIAESMLDEPHWRYNVNTASWMRTTPQL